jgi:hypothetical protein
MVKIVVCACSPAAIQLLSRGLFPCAPTFPSLAVDLNMLEFAKRLFVQCPPNVTGWCDTVDAFLGQRGYKLVTRVWVFSTDS